VLACKYLAIVDICRKLYISTHLGVAGIFFSNFNFLIESGLVFHFPFCINWSWRATTF